MLEIQQFQNGKRTQNLVRKERKIMALKITYKVRKKLSPRSEEEVGISLRVTESNRVDYTLATPFAVPYRFWDNKAGGIKDGVVTNDKAVFDRLILLNTRLNTLKKFLYEGLFRLDAFSKEDIKRLLDEAIDNITAKSEGVVLEEDKMISLPDYVDKLIGRMKRGSKRIVGEKYSRGTIKAWSSFAKLIREFYEDFKQRNGRELEWEDYNADGFSEFLDYMERTGYLPASINKYVIDLNAAITWATEEGVLENLIIKKRLPRKTVMHDDQTIKVYLTDDELQALFEMPLEEGTEKCKVRDIFLCGAYTGQRISDYNNLSPKNFKKSPKGYDLVVLTQEKTNSTVVIPVLNHNLLVIASKYEFQLPRVVEQVLNRYIKDILKELSESVPSLAEKYPTVLTMKERAVEEDYKKKHDGQPLFERSKDGTPLRPKYELVSSHTARRSCITNLYLQGRFTNEQIMSISGHKDEKTFKSYIVCSGVVIAEKIVEINAGKSNAELFM